MVDLIQFFVQCCGCKGNIVIVIRHVLSFLFVLIQLLRGRKVLSVGLSSQGPPQIMDDKPGENTVSVQLQL